MTFDPKNWSHTDDRSTSDGFVSGGSLRPRAMRASVLLGDWSATPSLSESVGQTRLRSIRSLLGTGAWRTGNLSQATVDAAVCFLLSFEAALLVYIRPRVAPTDAGGIMFEWEHGPRELFAEVLPGGLLDLLQVRGGVEECEGEGSIADAARLAKWLQNA